MSQAPQNRVAYSRALRQFSAAGLYLATPEVIRELTMFALMHSTRLESLHLSIDPTTGLKAIIAIHNSRLGPALGGLPLPRISRRRKRGGRRRTPGPRHELQGALAGLPVGGGCAVILRPMPPWAYSPVSAPPRWRAWAATISKACAWRSRAWATSVTPSPNNCMPPAPNCWSATSPRQSATGHGATRRTPDRQ